MGAIFWCDFCNVFLRVRVFGIWEFSFRRFFSSGFFSSGFYYWDWRRFRATTDGPRYLESPAWHYLCGVSDWTLFVRDLVSFQYIRNRHSKPLLRDSTQEIAERYYSLLKSINTASQESPDKFLQNISNKRYSQKRLQRMLFLKYPFYGSRQMMR